MPQVVKTKIAYIKQFAGLAKSAANRSRLIWKYPVVVVYLAIDYFPRLRRVLEASDQVSFDWVFEISDSTSL